MAGVGSAGISSAEKKKDHSQDKYSQPLIDKGYLQELKYAKDENLP